MTDVGTIPDLPPHPPIDEDAAIDPSRRSAIKVLWDLALIYGPASRVALHQHRPMISWNYREYVRWHPQAKGDHSDNTLREADKWAFDRAIDRSLERGWLVEQDGLLSVGTIPPQHVPLSTKSLDTVKQELTAMESKAAMVVLTAKANKSRRKPTREGRALLAKSLRERGQLEPIVVWQPHPMLWKDEIIVNGVTRAELLTDMGVEPVKRYLPTELTAAEVLLMRIEYEVAATSKDVSKAARDAYIEQLARDGVSYADIGKAVDLSQQHVGRILSAVNIDVHRGQAPPGKNEIARFVRLRDAGFPLRDIADDTQYSKTTIAKYLEIHDAGPQEPKERARKLTPGTAPAEFLIGLAEMGQATEAEVFAARDLFGKGAKVGKTSREKGYTKVVSGTVGRGGEPAVYALTDEGRTALAEIDYMPTPKPEPAPKLAAVPALPPPDVDEELIDLGFTKLQVIQILDVLSRHGIDVPRRARKAR